MAQRWLIDIPTEVRLGIYTVLFQDMKVYMHGPKQCTIHDKGQRTTLALLSTCKQVKAEAGPIFYAQANFQSCECLNWHLDNYSFGSIPDISILKIQNWSEPQNPTEDQFAFREWHALYSLDRRSSLYETLKVENRLYNEPVVGMKVMERFTVSDILGRDEDGTWFTFVGSTS